MWKYNLYLFILTCWWIVNNATVNVNQIGREINCTYHDPFFCNDGKQCIPQKEYCDGVFDCNDGSDEERYNPEYHFDKDGILCFKINRDITAINECFLPSQYVGDQTVHCSLGEDECGHNHSFTCHKNPEKRIDSHCILRLRFCDGIADCADHSDEWQYDSTKDGMQCSVTKIQGTFTCGLPHRYMCDGISDCDYGADECFCDATTGQPNFDSYFNGVCFRCLDGTTSISKNFLCDGIVHCKDLSDECLCGEKLDLCKDICKVGTDCNGCQVGQYMCKSNDKSSPKCIALDQICDLKFDCPMKEDEAHCVIKQSEIFQCHSGSQTILKKFQCNNDTDCLDGSDEVNCSSLFFECDEASVYYSSVPNKMHAYEPIRPRFTVACDLVSLCEDMEDECNATLCGPDLPGYCQFKDKINALNGFRCPSTQLALIASEVCDGYPTCLPHTPEKSTDELYCPNRFYCEDRGKSQLPIHVPESSRCNRISDCYDQSDELNCSLTTHFYCYSGAVLYVPRSKVCDGVQDCSNGEDECQECSVSPFSSDAYLINSYPLQVVIWIIGLISVVGNVVVFSYNIRQVWLNRVDMSKISYNHRLLVISLASADLLLGIYLLNIGITNQRFRGNYCQQDVQWRASNTCVAMGVLAVVSTECCIFLLVTMASMRLLLVARPFHAGIKRRYIILSVIIAFLTALTLAVIPLFDSQMDYFVSQVWYDNNPFLTKTNQLDAQELTSFMWSINITNNYTTLNSTSDRSYTWKNMIETIQIINSTYKPSLYFGYYSAHGVCLPRLFPNPRHDRSWGFSLFIISINFIAFIYMLVVYIAIYRISTNQSKTAGRADVDIVVSNLQRKITRIIFTNFCCWIPICLMAFLSAAGYQLSEDTYAVSAIILLPINSAFNPLLYSDLPDLIWRKVIVNTELGRYITQRQVEQTSKRTTITLQIPTKQTRNSSSNSKSCSSQEVSQQDTKL